MRGRTEGKKDPRGDSLPAAPIQWVPALPFQPEQYHVLTVEGVLVLELTAPHGKEAPFSGTPCFQHSDHCANAALDFLCFYQFPGGHGEFTYSAGRKDKLKKCFIYMQEVRSSLASLQESAVTPRAHGSLGPSVTFLMR